MAGYDRIRPPRRKSPACAPWSSHTIESLKLTIGDDGGVVDSLQAFRAKRGGGIYEATGIASDTEIKELRDLAKELQNRVLDWLRTHHAPLLKEPPRVRKEPRPRKRDRH